MAFKADKQGKKSAWMKKQCQSLTHATLTFSVMFFRIVSSKTACSLRLISSDSSRVTSESLAFWYNEDMVVEPLLSSSL